MLSHFVTPPFLIQKKLGKDGQALSFIYGGDEALPIKPTKIQVDISSQETESFIFYCRTVADQTRI